MIGRPRGRWGPDDAYIALAPALGYLNIDVVGADIVQIEALYRDDLGAQIHAAVP